MHTIIDLRALEVLDSRGRPTVQATCFLSGGVRGTAAVPSGASTGAAEAHELRDGDMNRYNGLGCRMAVANIREEIRTTLHRRTVNQAQLDRTLLNLDGTPHKSRLGANALLAVSLAFARAAATAEKIELYQYFASLIPRSVPKLPRLTINLFSGGKHAGGQVEIQDILLVPIKAATIDEGLEKVVAVYQTAASLTAAKYNMRLLRADEGGLAPPAASVEALLDDAMAAIHWAGLEAGGDMALAIDVASSHFYHDGRYHLGGAKLDSRAMIERVHSWTRNYPIVSVEDGLAEDDWDNWPTLRSTIGDRALVLGDDFLCTNPERIARAVGAEAANALLLKVNQIGTVSEAATAFTAARRAGWKITVSARSGETEDNWLADLATGWGGDAIKIGSITQSERLAKYNRLLEIEANDGLPVTAWG